MTPKQLYKIIEIEGAAQVNKELQKQAEKGWTWAGQYTAVVVNNRYMIYSIMLTRAKDEAVQRVMPIDVENTLDILLEENKQLRKQLNKKVTNVLDPEEEQQFRA